MATRFCSNNGIWESVNVTGCLSESFMEISSQVKNCHHDQALLFLYDSFL